ncbi:MAG: hypothetical protein HY719_02590 [Planctomycetes bacterium]|nr:hypothetical protein [Planctomycetota bacterium]
MTRLDRLLARLQSAWPLAYLAPPTLLATGLLVANLTAWATGAVPVGQLLEVASWRAEFFTAAGAALAMSGLLYLSMLVNEVDARRRVADLRELRGDLETRYYDHLISARVRMGERFQQFLARAEALTQERITSGASAAQRAYHDAFMGKFGLAARMFRILDDRCEWLLGRVAEIGEGRAVRARLDAARRDIEEVRASLAAEFVRLENDRLDPVAKRVDAVEENLATEIQSLRADLPTFGSDFALPPEVQQRVADQVDEVFAATAAEYAPENLAVDNKRRILLLEQRLTKLSGALSRAEGEIERLRAAALTGDGAAARLDLLGAPGVKKDDPRFREKSDVLRRIFEMNVALQKQKPRSQPTRLVAVPAVAETAVGVAQAPAGTASFDAAAMLAAADAPTLAKAA